MNKFLKIMIGISIIMVTLVLIIFYLINNQNNIMINNEEYNSETDNESIGTKTIARVTSRDDFYIVENCVKKYMKYLQDKEFEKIYGCLDKDYLDNEKITKNNIQEKMNNWKTGEFIAKKMYVYDDTKTVSEYFVYGLLQNEDYYIIVNVDYENETFSVLPNYYVDENSIQNNNGIKIIKIQN